MKALSLRKKLVLVAVFLVLALAPTVFVKPASSQTPLPTIFIRPDGTVYPSTAPIGRAETPTLLQITFMQP